MYLETMQQMFAQSSKVLVDTKSSNNMLYLPLDRLIQQTAREPVVNRTNPMTPPAAVPSQSSQRPAGSDSFANTLTRDRLVR